MARQSEGAEDDETEQSSEEQNRYGLKVLARTMVITSFIFIVLALIADHKALWITLFIGIMVGLGALSIFRYTNKRVKAEDYSAFTLFCRFYRLLRRKRNFSLYRNVIVGYFITIFINNRQFKCVFTHWKIQYFIRHSFVQCEFLSVDVGFNLVAIST